MKVAAKLKKGKSRTFVKIAIVFILIGGFFLVLKHRKEVLVRECTRLLETSLSRGTDMKVRIGKVSGHLAGFVSFKNVSVEEPWLPQGEETLFYADEIRIKYRWLDFFSKNFSSNIEVSVIKPMVRWRPRVSIKKPNFPFFSWMRDWALSQKSHFAVHISAMTLLFGEEKKELKGIDLDYEKNKFHIEIPLSHVRFGVSDLSSVIKVDGGFQPGVMIQEDAITGQITTEGTVINWKPLPYESKFEFSFSRESFHISSSNFLGGAEAAGQIDFTNDYEIDFTVKAKNYLWANLDPLFNFGKSVGQHTHMDMVTRFQGNPWAPNVESRWRIYGAGFGKKTFKAMDVSVEGVYPTVKLTNSRILLQDGSSMRIADKTLEARELFKAKTYETLVTEAEQDTVVWGDWELSRQKDGKDGSEFVMQRNLGSKANVHFSKFNKDDKPMESRETTEVEVGFEYHLRGKDSLKFELRDDEEFVGVERKMKF